MVLGKLYRSLLSAYSLANRLNDRQSIMHDVRDPRLVVSWSGETSRNTLSAHFLPVILDIKPSELPLHIHLVGPTYHILALLIALILLSTHFLVAASYKHMSLTTSFYSTSIIPIILREIH